MRQQHSWLSASSVVENHPPAYISVSSIPARPNSGPQEKQVPDMAAIDTLRAPSAHQSGIFDRAAATLRHWADVRETRKQLSALSDRELSDIGLTRGDIERVARGY